MAPTNVSFPLSPSGQIVPYNYSIDYSPMKGRDVLREFVNSCEQRKIRTGFYYTVATNTWFNVGGGIVSVSSVFMLSLYSFVTNRLRTVH